MTDQLSDEDREELGERLESALSGMSATEREEFYQDNRNLFDKMLTELGNKFSWTEETAPRSNLVGKPKVSAISKLIGVTKGGAVSDALRGVRDLPDEHIPKLIEGWQEYTTKFDEAPRDVDIGVNSQGRLYDKNTGRWV